MTSPRRSLNVLHVPSPCEVSWKSMTGTDQVRFCSNCRKDVYNLSAMSAEAERVVNATGDSPCVRFYRRLDGTVVTTDRCGNRVTRAWRRFTATVGAALVGLASLAGCDCSKLGLCTQGKMVPPAGAKTTPASAANQPADDDDEGDEEEE